MLLGAGINKKEAREDEITEVEIAGDNNEARQAKDI